MGRCCLVHSDFNPKNLLVDPDTLEVTGLLDWEFAHAGHPYTDLGNLLRFERDPVFTDGGARRRTSPAAAARPPRPWPWPVPRTCGRCSTSPAAVRRTRSPRPPTGCCERSRARVTRRRRPLA